MKPELFRVWVNRGDDDFWYIFLQWVAEHGNCGDSESLAHLRVTHEGEDDDFMWVWFHCEGCEQKRLALGPY